MSTLLAPRENAAADVAPAPARITSLSPNQRAWRRFRRNKLGVVSLVLLAILLFVSLFAEVFSNDRPLAARYDGKWYFPILSNPPEVTFGGDFATPTEWSDPMIQEQFAKPGNLAIPTINRWGVNTLDYFARAADPAKPSARHWLGTDWAGRDMTARLLYGFRTSVFFGLALTVVATILGVAIGALQGYFAGRVDLFWQRIIEIWNAIPELYLLLIVATIFTPTLLLLVVLFALFGWIGLSDYVRAEFLRNRNLEFVRAARAMGLSNLQIMWRHILPNSLTPVITFLPFRMSAAIVFLTSLDFLGLGVPGTASLGELLQQGKDNLDAWWITIPTFAVLTILFLLLTFIGDALRAAFDTRKS